MTQTIMTFGDSNTYGTPPAHQPGENRRYDASIRWPRVMQRALGDGYEVIEQGLPGRTTAFPDTIMGDHMDGRIGLRIALESNGPIDLLIIMLGTNDLQTHYGKTPEQVIGGVASLLAIAKSEVYQTRHGGFEVMLICPPEVLEQGCYRNTLYGAAAKSKALPPLYQGLADHWGIPILFAQDVIQSSPLDGLHFEAEDQVALGKAIAAKVAAL